MICWAGPLTARLVCAFRGWSQDGLVPADLGPGATGTQAGYAAALQRLPSAVEARWRFALRLRPAVVVDQDDPVRSTLAALAPLPRALWWLLVYVGGRGGFCRGLLDG